MARDSWINWTLATLGLAAAGFAAGLHRLVWGLFWFATLIWWVFVWWGHFAGHPYEDITLIVMWALTLGPPLLIGVVLRLVERIVFAVLGSSIRGTDSSVSSSRDNGPMSR